MKKFVIGLVIGMAIMATGSVFAEDGLEKIDAYLRPSLPITLNGNSVTLENPPVMYDGSTYLRLRDLAKITGLPVNWDDATQTVQLGTVTGATYTPIVISKEAKPQVINETPQTITEPTEQRTLSQIESEIEIAKMNIKGISMSIESSVKRIPDDPRLQEFKDRLARYQSELADLERQKAELQQ